MPVKHAHHQRPDFNINVEKQSPSAPEFLDSVATRFDLSGFNPELIGADQSTLVVQTAAIPFDLGQMFKPHSDLYDALRDFGLSNAAIDHVIGAAMEAAGKEAHQTVVLHQLAARLIVR